MYRYVFFDVDGTLIDTERADLQALRDVILEITGEDVPVERLRFAMGIPGTRALKKLGVQDVDRAFALWRKYYERYAQKTEIFEGIVETLFCLADLSRVLGVVTSRTRLEFALDLIPLRLTRHFPYVVCADDTVKHKPDAEPMLKLLELTKADPASALYVGDTVYDRQCAHAAGVDFALALWGGREENLDGSDYVLSHPRDIIGIVL